MFCKLPVLQYLVRSFVPVYHRCIRSKTMKILEVEACVAALNKFAPENIAEKWDNVGLLIDEFQNCKISKILLTIDLTMPICYEAIEKSTDLIISYHPPIFAPLKQITIQTWKEHLVAELVKHNIAVYSPHTSWDNVAGGLNDWLASALPIANSRPIQESPSNPSYGAGRICELKTDMGVNHITSLFRKHTKISHLMLALPEHYGICNGTIRTVAVCAGSGASVLKGVKADLYVTGEMSHHEILDATHQNTHVILLGHCSSERGFLPVFKGILSDLLKDYTDVTIDIAERDQALLKLSI